MKYIGILMPGPVVERARAGKSLRRITLRVLITGAGGFVGRALSEKVRAAMPSADLVLLDTQPFAFEAAEVIVGDLANERDRARAIGGGVDLLFHLAAVPGGAAEANPQLSRRVNLDATLDLFEAVGHLGKPPRIVYTSTIGVFGGPLPAVVDDATAASPWMFYGAHKLMVEIALAHLHRRGLVKAVGVRLAGIVARPAGASGLKSAFMSNVFHDLAAGRNFVSPVSAHATFWLMSVARTTDNLLHAAKLDPDTLPDARVVTLPAVLCSMQALVDAIRRHAGTKGEVTYAPDAALERGFGNYPPLQADAARSLGFADDGSLEGLVENVLPRRAGAAGAAEPR